MKDEALARRYARALLAAAGPLAAEVDEDLATLAAVLNNEPYRRLFLHPAVGEATKKAWVAQALGETTPARALLGRFLAVLIDHRREGWLWAVARALHAERLAAEGITEAVVQTARPLPPADRERLLQALGGFLRRRLVARFEVFPELLGGVRVRFADRLLDASALGELSGLRHQLLGNQSR